MIDPLTHEEWRKSLNQRAQVEEEMLQFERALRKGLPLFLSPIMMADKLHDWAMRLGVPDDWRNYKLPRLLDQPQVTKPDANGWHNPHAHWIERIKARAVPMTIAIAGAGCLLAAVYALVKYH